jgi:hypothetical protein
MASSCKTNFLGPSTFDSDFSGSLASSIESGDEEVSPPRFTKLANCGALTDLFGSMTFGSFTDSDPENDSGSFNNNDFNNHVFTNFDFIDTSVDSREVVAGLYDGVTDPESDENTTAIYHQICVIGGTSRQVDEVSEAFDNLGNPYIDPVDLTRGTGNKYIGTMLQEKVQLPQEAWDRAQRAMDGTEPTTTAATPEALQASQYKIARSKRELDT